MLDHMEVAILSALQTIFDRFGWAGVFGLMVLENATGIAPGEVILGLSGWMLIERHGIAPAFILIAGAIAGLGSAIGASITYWTARLGGQPMIEKFTRLLHIDTGIITASEEHMQKWGLSLVLVGRIIPGMRTWISLPAGLVRIHFPKFFIVSFIGGYIWCTLLIGAGYLLGHEWMMISSQIKGHLPLALLLGLLAVAGFLFFRNRTRLHALVRVLHFSRKASDKKS
ncbi:MAG: DedA family protein [Chloroflexi bacterium]|nr:DedA family protein [Chloroflexota bacterium]